MPRIARLDLLLAYSCVVTRGASASDESEMVAIAVQADELSEVRDRSRGQRLSHETCSWY